MTNSHSIQDVLLFPQMKPEKKAARDGVEVFEEIGVPTEWVPVIQKTGYTTLSALKDVSAGKLHNQICGMNKKHKMDLQNPTIDQVKEWLANID